MIGWVRLGHDLGGGNVGVSYDTCTGRERERKRSTTSWHTHHAEHAWQSNVMVYYVLRCKGIASRERRLQLSIQVHATYYQSSCVAL